MKPFVSVCMIVKNEEKVIERCLSSVAHLVDEVIIVDTGSTDLTKEIAAKFTSNIYHFDWISDFSAARNFAASKASGEWILVLDADEYVDEENFNEFINELKVVESNIEAFTAKILNFTGRNGENLIQNYHDRVYKNNGEISYYRKIHEQFKRNDDEPLQIKNSGLLLFHSGYLNKTVKEKAKSQRNKELLDQEFNENANKAFDYFNFGNEYFSIGEYSKALDAYLEAYKLKKDFRLSWVSTTLIQIIFCLMQLKRYKDALNVIQDAENIYQSSPEFPFLKGEIFLVRGQIDEGKEIFHYILNNKEKYNHIIFRPDLNEEVPHRRLGGIYFNKKDFQNAIVHFVGVLNLNKYCEESIKKVIEILNMFHSPEEIHQFLISKNLVDENNLQFYVRVCLELGNPKLALLIIENFMEGHQLLYTIAKLKLLVVHNEGEVTDLLSIMNPATIRDLNAANWINITDLYLLKNIDQLSEHLTFLDENHDFKKSVLLLEGTGQIENSEEIFLVSLVTLLRYKKFQLCNVLLNRIESIRGISNAKVAAILYENGFKAEALHLYDKGDFSSYTQRDFECIIESLLETGDKINAVQFSQYALQLYPENFIFYKFILDNTEEKDEYNITLKKAKTVFG